LSSPSDRVIAHSQSTTVQSLPAPAGEAVGGWNHDVAPPSTPVATRNWLDIRARTIDDQRTRIRRDELPEDVSKMEDRPETPLWIDLYAAELRPVDFCASARIFHKPLYFEDRYLERLGVSRGLLGHVPPLRSGVHFMASAALLPLKVLHDPPHRCVGSPCTCQCRSLSRPR
jgi:hypothetical protein